MITQLERISVSEIKIETLEEKIDELKVDVKDMHDCLDKTRDSIIASLKEMGAADSLSHATMLDKITALEQFKTKWVYLTAGGIAVMGWLFPHTDTLLNLIK